MNRDDITRRNFLVRLSAVTGLSVGAGAFLAACGGGDSGSAPEAEVAAAAEPVATGCTDVSGLTDAEVLLRTSLQYVDETPDADKTCEGCALFVAPESGAGCGTCTLIKGPIAAAGYCTSWAALPS